MSVSEEYALIDSGNGRKLEQFGPYLLDRPCSQAVWQPMLPPSAWEKAQGCFLRRERDSRWIFREKMPREWICQLQGVKFLVSPTDFGHIGIFPEHALGWRWMKERIAVDGRKNLSLLNLFAYTGGATLALAQTGAALCHLDASRKTVDWAHRNAECNGLEGHPIRWIVDDVNKFLQREIRRGHRYDGIVLDPPSFGRGTNQEIFKIDTALTELLRSCLALLSEQPVFLFLSCHTPGYTPMVLKNLLGQLQTGGTLTAGEMWIPGQVPLPSGSYVAWQP